MLFVHDNKQYYTFFINLAMIYLLMILFIFLNGFLVAL